MPGKKVIALFYFLFVISCLSFSQTDSTYWNREFNFGATTFLSLKSLPFHDLNGHYQPGYSFGYSLKKMKSSGKGFTINFGVNSFGWKSDKVDYYETLSPDQIELTRAINYSLFHYTFSTLSFSYCYRKIISDFIFEGEIAIGSRLLTYSRYRDIRKYESGGFKYLRDDQSLRLNIAPAIAVSGKIAKRMGKKHLVFFKLSYLGLLNTGPVSWYSFTSYSLGLSKDFIIKKRKPRSGKKFNDNYIYAEALGMAQYYSLNYERNLSTFENFRLNIRAGFGYYEVYDQIIGLNLVLGNRVERFEIGLNYNNRRDANYENATQIVSAMAGYRAETKRNWLFKLSLGPSVSILPESHDFYLRFGASIGKKFGKK